MRLLIFAWIAVFVPGNADSQTTVAPVSVDGGCSAQRAGAAAASRTGTIAGQIIDKDRRPVRSARVSLQRVRVVEGGAQQLEEHATAATNARGEFQSDALPSGEYYVSAVPPAAASFTANPRAVTHRTSTAGVGPTFYPGTTWFSQARPVFLSPGGALVGIDIVLEPKRLARVSGRMVSSSGALKDGAYVALAPEDTAGRAGLHGFLGVSQVGPDGTFVIDGVPPGEYRLQGRSLPLRSVESIAMTGRSRPLTSDADAEFGTMAMTIDGADIEDVQLMLTRGGRIRGRVTIDGRAMQPQAGVRLSVRAEPTGGDTLTAGPTDAAVRDDGAFDIRGLAGTFVLRVNGLGRALALAGVEADKRNVTDDGMLVDPREEATAEVALTSHPTELAGHVIADAGARYRNCWVIVFAHDSQQWSLAATRYVAAGRVRADGAYEIRGLPPGRYFAVAVGDVEDGQWRDPAYLRSLSGKAKDISLREAEARTADLPLVSGS